MRTSMPRPIAPMQSRHDWVDVISHLSGTRAAGTSMYYNGSEYVSTTQTTLRSGAYTEPIAGGGGIGPGVLLEPASTNHVTYSETSTATVGEISGAGALPTNWTWGVFTDTDDSEVVATGTENGLQYIDLRINFSQTTGTSYPQFFTFPWNTYPAALTGEWWTMSWFYKKVSGGDFSGITSWNLGLREVNSSNGTVKDNNSSALPDIIPSGFTRFSHTVQLSGGGTTAKVWPFIQWAVGAGESADVTIRFYHPQVEKHSAPTSPIVTSGSTASRVADPEMDLTTGTIDSMLSGNQISVYCEYSLPANGSGVEGSYKAWRTSGGSGTYDMAMTETDSRDLPDLNADGASTAAETHNPEDPSHGTLVRTCFSADSTNNRFAVNGTSSTGTHPYDTEDTAIEVNRQESSNTFPHLLCSLKIGSFAMTVGEIESITGG